MCHDGNFDLLHLIISSSYNSPPHWPRQISPKDGCIHASVLSLIICTSSLVNVEYPSMNSSISAAVLRRVSVRPASSTCTSCRGQFTKFAQARPSTSRNYGSKRNFHSSRTSKPAPSSRRTVLLCASFGAAGASVLAVGDDIKGAYEGTQRAGRVASALFICINE